MFNLKQTIGKLVLTLIWLLNSYAIIELWACEGCFYKGYFELYEIILWYILLGNFIIVPYLILYWQRLNPNKKQPKYIDTIKHFFNYSNEKMTATYVLKVVLHLIFRYLGLVWLTGVSVAVVAFLTGLLGFAFLIVIPFL